MAVIPKKVIERFIKVVPRFQKVLQIAKDRDVNEADTVSVLKDMWGDVFGFDKYIEVTSEFAIRGTYCDLAIKVGDKVQFLIEAKAIGIELKDNHLRQVIDYGANHGVKWVVLTNGIEWKTYMIRFEQPINYDLVCTFDFLSLNPRDPKDQEFLHTMTKEGLSKNAREAYFERIQTVNRYIIGSLILNEPVLSTVRRELRKLADGLKIDTDEVEKIVRTQVLKRDVVEGDRADDANTRVGRFYKKSAVPRKKPANKGIEPPSDNESITDRLLREADESTNITAPGCSDTE